MGVIEVVLILVVLIGLVIIFKKQINDLLEKRVQGDQQTVERGVLMKKSGQITVFLSMVLLCIAALLGGADGIGQDRRGQVLSADCRRLRPGFCDGRIPPGTLGEIPDSPAGIWRGGGAFGGI